MKNLNGLLQSIITKTKNQQHLLHNLESSQTGTNPGIMQSTDRGPEDSSVAVLVVVVVGCSPLVHFGVPSRTEFGRSISHLELFWHNLLESSS